MTKSVFIFNKNRLRLPTKYIFPDIESLLRSIDWSLDDLESLPTDLWLLIVLAMWEVVECRELLTVEDRWTLPPGELTENVVLDK